MTHRVRVQKHDLDVEHDEEHRDEVEAHREALRRLATRHDAALVRGLFRRVRTPWREQARREPAQGGEERRQHEHHEDGEELSHGQVFSRETPCRRIDSLSREWSIAASARKIASDPSVTSAAGRRL